MLVTFFIMGLNTDVKIAYRATNTIFKQLTIKPDRTNNPNGIYSIKCITCNKKYVGQSGMIYG